MKGGMGRLVALHVVSVANLVFAASLSNALDALALKIAERTISKMFVNHSKILILKNI
nr:hypothetical protein [Azospirillum sp. 412522]